MWKILFLIPAVFLLSSGCITTVAAQPVDFETLIPEGWTIKSLAEGDLNNDSLPDAAVVIEKVSTIDDLIHRALILFVQEDGEYKLSLKNDAAILRADEGGVWGDPFESLSIDNGTLVLRFYGGSNWRWYSQYQFNFQNDGWYLSRATLGSYFTGTTTSDAADEENYNLLTGAYIIKKADENGRIITNEGNRGKRSLLNLNDFIANSAKNQF